MNVYVLHYRWDNADTEGTEVLGVYAENNLAAAQKAMRENAASVRSPGGGELLGGGLHLGG